MKLDIKDRLILVNQYKILEALYPDDADHYEKHRIALMEGYELHYNWMVEWFAKEGLSKAQCREVLDILDMYRAITFSLEDLEDEELKREMHLIFKGFDGNNESELRRYVEYFIIELDRYDELKYGQKNPSFNSHSKKLPLYQRQLNIWYGFDKSYELTEEQLRALANPYG